jgi:succinate dehydrogenase/fumarate reductase flavoprotein subunit
MASIQWQRAVDVIVLGSGVGLLAAIRAAEAGLQVLVLEKGAEIGGTTGISGGALYIPDNYVMRQMGLSDSRAEALEYLRRATFGQGDPALLETYVDTANEVLNYLRRHGLREWQVNGFFQDYYPDFPGSKPNGRNVVPVTHPDSLGGGSYLIGRLRQAAETLGVEFLLKTPARRLITGDGQAVIGVQAEQNGQEAFFQARAGVVVATGGMDHDPVMTRNFLRGPIFFSAAVAANTGDGHKLGMQVGAGLTNMNECWGAPGYYHQDYQTYIVDWGLERGKPGALIVNRAGRRFLNESAAYHPAARAFYDFDTGMFEYRNIPGFTLVDAEYRRRYSLLSIPPDQALPAWIARGQTLCELAACLGIDAANLQATVARFNAYACQGLDPDYHRGESAFDTSTGGDPSRQDLANPCLAPLATPPYYGVAIWPGTIGTNGGLHINADGQVLNPFGQAIPGLYAAGNVTGSPMGAGYPGGGVTIGAGLIFAYRAANHLASRAAVAPR